MYSLTKHSVVNIYKTFNIGTRGDHQVGYLRFYLQTNKIEKGQRQRRSRAIGSSCSTNGVRGKKTSI